MIAKSDLIILLVSSSLLGVAVYRWDQNTRNVDTSTVLASTQITAPIANNTTVAPAIDDSPSVLTTDTDGGETVSGTGVNDSESIVNSDTPVITSTTANTVENIDVTQPESSARPFQIHVVESGDSLSEIAARYNTSVSALREANGIEGSTIFIGQEILYPSN